MNARILDFPANHDPRLVDGEAMYTRLCWTCHERGVTRFTGWSHRPGQWRECPECMAELEAAIRRIPGPVKARGESWGLMIAILAGIVTSMLAMIWIAWEVARGSGHWF